VRVGLIGRENLGCPVSFVLRRSLGIGDPGGMR
jgi:hypothetical protein